MSDAEAAQIKQLREVLGMTQEELAREMGVSFSTVSRWETGRGSPSPLARRRLEELRARIKPGTSSRGRR